MDNPLCSPPTAPASAPAPAPANRTKSKPKPSIFSRLRSKPHNPYSHPSGASSTPVIPLHRANGTNTNIMTNTNNSNSNSNNNGAGSVRGMQVSAPIMLGMNRSEEIFGAANTTSNGMGLEDEIEWERVRTLPRVRLVPPEDEGEPIILYPPPHFLRPATPPPRLPHPFLSPPSSPPRRSSASASSPPPTSPPRRPSSIYSSNPSWAGMADGFVLPPPKFSRPPASASGAYNARNGAAGVVMPKTRRELVQDREKRMSAVWIANDISTGISSPPPKPSVLDLMEHYGLPSQSEDTTIVKSLDQVSGEMVEPTLSARPISPPVPLPSAEGEAPEQIVAPIQATTDVNSQPNPIRDNPPKPPSSSSKAARKSRALSLSAALSSSTTTCPNDTASPEPPLPSVPSVIRKQKSLKKFFSSTSTSTTENDTSSVPSVPAPAPSRRSSMEEPKSREGKPRSGGGILSRAKSKPSLRIDVKATKSSGPSVRSAPVTPALSTGVSDTSSSSSSALSDPQTPKSAPISQTTTPTPRLSKRFSLSNMSHAFKKAIGTPSTSMLSNPGSQVPKVPDLPEVYRKERDIRGTGRVLESAVPLSPRTRTTPLVQAQENDQSILTPTGLPRRSESLKALQQLAQGEVDDCSTYDTPSALGLTLGPASPPILPPLGPAFDHQASNTDSSRPLSVVSSHTICEVGSTTIDSIDPSELDIEENEQELVHAQLMKVSPRTRRDPSISLQQYIANVRIPGIQNNVVIVPVPRGMRRSVEAVVLGSLTTPPGMAVGNERSVLDRLNELEEDEDKRISIAELERRGSGDTIEEEGAVTTPLDGPAFFLSPVVPPTRISRSKEEEVSRMDKNKEDDLDSLPSDTVLVETPPTQTSTISGTATAPGKGLTSPEKILRKLSRNKPQQQTPYQFTSLNERTVIPIPLPPLPLPFDRDGEKENVNVNANANARGGGGTKPHSALLAAVQLRSLHFDRLDLDFGKWSKTPVSAAMEGVDW